MRVSTQIRDHMLGCAVNCVDYNLQQELKFDGPAKHVHNLFYIRRLRDWRKRFRFVDLGSISLGGLP
jgi:hypothetical protein